MVISPQGVETLVTMGGAGKLMAGIHLPVGKSIFMVTLEEGLHAANYSR